MTRAARIDDAAIALTLALALALAGCGRGSSVSRTARGVSDDEGGPPVFDRTGTLPDPLTSPYGFLAGALDIDRNGAANYSLALDLPPGRAGLAPILSLGYSSNRGQGSFGMGFALSGVSQIERCQATFAEDDRTRELTYLRGDPFCWNGERLIEVTQTRFEDGLRKEYRTRRDQNARIVAFGPAATDASDWEPDRFEVETADGRIHDFGATDAAKRIWRDGRTATFAWLIEKTRDRFGNAILYNYTKHTPASWPAVAGEDVEVLLDRIVYTAHEPTGLAGAQAIQLSYIDDPNNEFVGYRHGMRNSVTRLVEQIEMSTGGQPTWRYELTYRRSTSTGRSLLESIQKCSHGSGCLDAISLQYQEPVLAAPTGIDVTPLSDNDDDTYTLMDVDGDGRADLVRKYPTTQGGDEVLTAEIALSQAQPGSTTNPFPTFSATSLALPYDEHSIIGMLPLDFDRDGRTDLMFYRLTGLGAPSDTPSWRFLRSTGTDFETHTLFATAIAGQMWGDYDGDGRPDLSACFLSAEADSDRMGIRLNTDGINVESEWRVSRTIGQACGTSFGGFSGPVNFDGDGAADILVNEFPRASAISIVDGEPEMVVFTPELIPGGAARSFCGPDGRYCPGLLDFNGDGHTDILVANDVALGANSIYYGTGLGFDGEVVPGYEAVKGFPFPNGTYTNGGGGVARYGRDAQARGDGLVGPYALTTDVNLDGKDDFLRPGANHTLEVLISSGQSSLAPFSTWRQTLSLAVPDEGEPVRFSTVGDVDGNGAPDVLTWTGQRHMLYLFDQPRPDLLTAINETPQAETYSIQYAPLSRSDIYDRQSCAATYPTKCVPGSGHYVVESVEIDAGPDQERRTLHYRYENGKSNIAGLGWVGFEKVVRTDEATGAVSETTYDLAYHPDIRAYPSAAIPTSSTTTVEVDDLDHPGGVEQIETTTTVATVVKRADHTYFTYVSTRHSRTRQDGVLLSESHLEVDEVDGFGNITDWHTEVAGETVTTGRRVANDVMLWSIGRPEYEETSSQTTTETRIRYRAWGWDPWLATLDWSSDRFGPSGDDPLRVTTYLSYDDYGNVEAIENTAADGSTRRTDLVHDDPQHMFPQTVTDALGATVQLFDPRYGTLVRHQTPGGVITRYAHDGFGRLVTVENGDATLVQRWFRRPLDHDLGYLRIDTDAPGVPTRTVEHDRLGRSFRSVWVAFDGSEVEQRIVYDRFGRVSEQWEPVPVGATPAPQERRRLHYDVLGRLTVEVGLGGGYSVHDYDPRGGAALGVTVETFNPRGHASRVERDAAGRTVRTVDAAGGVTHYRHGAFSRLRELEDADGNLTVVSHDDYGWRTAIDEPSSGVTGYAYTAFGELDRVTYADGATTSFRFDQLGRIEQRTESDGDVTAWTYDSAPNGLGLLASATGPDGHAVELTYDWAQRQASRTQQVAGASYTYEFHYDDEGRPRTMAYPHAADGSRLVVRHQYKNGHLYAVTDDATQEAFWVRLAADPTGRTTSEIYGNGVRTERTFTPWGALASVRVHDGLGRSSPADFRSARYEYDQNHNLLGRSDLFEGWQEAFEFDPLDRLRKACIAGRTDPLPVPPRADGRPATPGPPFGGGFLAEDRSGILVDPYLSVGNQLGYALDIGTTDATDNRLIRTFGAMQTSKSDWRAREAVTVVPECATTEYDAIGNIRNRSEIGDYTYELSIAETIDTPDGPNPRERRLVNAVGSIARVDGSREDLDYDPRGRLLSNRGETFEWTAHGRVRRIANRADGWDVSFEYGPFAERSLKTSPFEVTSYAGAFERRETHWSLAASAFIALDSIADHHFIHADGRVVAEVIRHSTPLSGIRFGFTAGGDDLGIDPGELEERSHGMEGGRLSSRYTLQFYHHDGLGSVEHITGPLGHSIEQRSYDPWGSLRVSPINTMGWVHALWASQQPVGFTGHETDEEFGLVNMGGRIYDPRIGRVISPDPLISSPLSSQSLNRYSYALNNPVSLVDPSGYWPDEPGGPHLGDAGNWIEPGGPRLGTTTGSPGSSAGNPLLMPDLHVFGKLPSETPSGGDSLPPSPGQGASGSGADGTEAVDAFTYAARNADTDAWKRGLVYGVVQGTIVSLSPGLAIVFGMVTGMKNSQDSDISFVFDALAVVGEPASAGRTHINGASRELRTLPCVNCTAKNLVGELGGDAGHLPRYESPEIRGGRRAAEQDAFDFIEDAALEGGVGVRIGGDESVISVRNFASHGLPDGYYIAAAGSDKVLTIHYMLVRARGGALRVWNDTSELNGANAVDVLLEYAKAKKGLRFYTVTPVP